VITLTRARARCGIATKVVRVAPGAPGIEIDPYPNECRWALYRESITDVLSLATMIQHMPQDTCFLRGQPAAWIPPGSYTLRRLDETIEDRPSRAIILDVDELPEPPGVDLIADPADAAAYAVSKLPDPFAEASYIWAASASAGFKPGLIKMKLLFASEQPLDAGQHRALCKGINARARLKLVDLCMSTPSQPIYLAPPLCESVPDPLQGRRVGYWRGLEDRVAVDLNALPVSLPEITGAGSGLGWRAHLGAIGGPEGFRGPIVRAVCAAVAEAGGLPMDLHATLAAVAAAIRAADPGHRSTREIERYASNKHLMDIARWAAWQQAKEGAAIANLRRRIFRMKP
jgi:hypothetical protein